MNKPNDTVAINIRGVPRDYRDAFRAWCARRGFTLAAGLVRLYELQVGSPREEEDELASTLTGDPI